VLRSGPDRSPSTTCVKPGCNEKNTWLEQRVSRQRDHTPYIKKVRMVLRENKRDLLD